MLKLIQNDIRIARQQGWTYRYIHELTKSAVDYGKFVTWVDWEGITDPAILSKTLSDLTYDALNVLGIDAGGLDIEP